MLEVTDMALCVRNLAVPGGPAVDLVHAESDERNNLLRLVESEHSPFLPYYQSPSADTTACAIKTTDGMVGGVLLQRPDNALESRQDAAIAALFIARQQRNRGLGSAAIAAAAQMLANEGFERIIAEWVWSVQMYQRLGFAFWRTRRVEQ